MVSSHNSSLEITPQERNTLYMALDFFERIGSGHLEDFAVLQQAGLLVDKYSKSPTAERFEDAFNHLMEAKQAIYHVTDLKGTEARQLPEIYKIASSLKQRVQQAVQATNQTSSTILQPASQTVEEEACMQKLPAGYMIGRQGKVWGVYYKDKKLKKLKLLDKSLLLVKVVDSAIEHKNDNK